MTAGMAERAGVFLSSTTVGLRAVRDVAKQAIEEVGCRPIGMEDFGAVPDYPDRVCQERVDHSDIYVGILGQRYGSRPQGSEESYTEREYRYATVKGLPCLVFLLSDALCADELAVPEPPRLQARQADFRRLVTGSWTVKSITSLDELRREVSDGLRRCLDSEPWGIHDIFGRRSLLAQVHRAAVADRRDLGLVGIGGMGKSALLRAFRDWEARRAAATPGSMRLWFQELREDTDTTAGVTGLVPQNLGALAEAALGRRSRDIAVLPQLADRLAARLADGQRTVVVLDNASPGQVDALATVFGPLARYDNLSFVVASRFGDLPRRLGDGLGRTLARWEVPQLAVSAGVDLLTWTVAQMMGVARESARPDLPRIAHVLERLAGFAAGYPLVLRALAGLLLRAGDSVAHVARTAHNIEIELQEMRDGLTRALGPGADLHAADELAATLEKVLGEWLKPGRLTGAARDLLAICSVLPPAPASYSVPMLRLHWDAALEVSVAVSKSGRQREPLLYQPAAGNTGPRDRAFDAQLGKLFRTQLLQEESRPVGRESRCQDLDPAAEEARYGLHAMVAGFFQRRLLDASQRRALHAAAEQALRVQLEEGPLTTLSGMYAIETALWQEQVSLWLYHLAHLDPEEARFRMARLYLDAFWWWGVYVPFPFCELLINNWERVVVPPEAADGHVDFLHFLLTVHEKYPKGWDKAGTDMRPVEQALNGLAELVGVDVTAAPESFDDEDHLHLYGLLRLFLGGCARFPSATRPIPGKDFTAAREHYEAACTAFADMAKRFGNHIDDWNVSWLRYELAALHAEAGRLAEAEVLCERSAASEHARVAAALARGEKEYVLDELLSDIASVRADIAQQRGDLTAEAGFRALALFHAYAQQVRPPQAVPCAEHPDRYEGGPDSYTSLFYREMMDRALRRVYRMFADGMKSEARAMADEVARCWHERFPPEALRVLDALGPGSPATPELPAARRALFPAEFDPAADDLDDYVSLGLELAERARQRGGW